MTKKIDELREKLHYMLQCEEEYEKILKVSQELDLEINEYITSKKFNDKT